MALKVPSVPRLRPTSWLATRLGISVSTIEKLRSQGSSDIPPHITIGRLFRYDDAVVDRWISQRISEESSTPSDSNFKKGSAQ